MDLCGPIADRRHRELLEQALVAALREPEQAFPVRGPGHENTLRPSIGKLEMLFSAQQVRNERRFRSLGLSSRGSSHDRNAPIVRLA